MTCPGIDGRPCGVTVDNDGRFCEACAERALIMPWGMHGANREYEPDSDPRKVGDAS